MKDFDEQRAERAAASRPEDRTFRIGGEDFTLKVAVAPEMIFDWSEVASGDREVSQREWMVTADRTIRELLEPGQEERWDAVRARDAAHPVTLDDLIEVLKWCLEEVVGRPTGQPSDSSDGPASTATGSTDDSSSPGEPEPEPST